VCERANKVFDRHDLPEVRMSENIIESFLAHLEANKELQHQLQSRMQEATARTIAAFGAEQGFEFSGEEFAQLVTTQLSELSEEELDMAAGGVYVGQDLPSTPAKAAAFIKYYGFGFESSTR
jgi:predicted ribosomally synthesized peptide with nif11-like leader